MSNANQLPSTKGFCPRDILWAALLFAGALSLYVATACRTIHTGDSPELALAITTFGVPHPPGYALYTLLSALLARLIPVADRAFAANLVSAFYGAFAIALLYALARRIGMGLLAATLGALLLALGRTFWSQALVAEVYVFDALLLLLTLHVLCTWSLTPSRRWTLILGFVAGLWIGHRFINLLYVPALALFAAWRAGLSARAASRAIRRAPARWGLGVAGLLLAFTVPLLYLPLASAANPPLDIGDPESWDRLWTVLTGAPYRRHLLAGGLGPAMRRVAAILIHLPWELGLGLLLAGYGALSTRRIRPLVWALLALLATNIALTAIYNILDIRQYTLPALVALSILASHGAQIIQGALGTRAARSALLAAALGAAALLLPLNLGANNLSHHSLARRFGEDLLQHLPRQAVLIVNGDTVVHSLWFLQGAEARRSDVLIISAGHLAPWYLDQLRKRHPAESWPPSAALSTPRGRYELVEGLAQRRPVFFSMDAASLLAPGGLRARQRFALVRRAFATELVERDGTAAPPHTAEDAAAVERAVSRAMPLLLARPSDVDTQALVLEYALALFRSAAALQRAGQIDDARRLLARIKAIDPDPLEAEMGRAYRIIGREMPPLRLGERARQLLATPVAVDSAPARAPTSRPSAAPSTDALNQRGVQLARAGRFTEALPFFESALKAHPNHVGARFNRAKTLAALGRRQEAIKAFEILAARKPVSAVVLSHLAELLTPSDPTRARQLLREALAAPDGARFAPEIRRKLQRLDSP